LAADSELPGRAVRWGTVIAILDIASAMSFWAVYRGVSPLRILQSVAAGLQGKAAFTGGAASALLGAGLHLLIAWIIAGSFAWIVSAKPILMRHPLRTGALAGLVVYAVMNFAVVPLSQAAPPRFDALWVLYSVAFSHVVCVGICLALLARREGVGGGP
jgi:uncharacterized membrane protein YagU involved in acid resistance